MRTDSRASRVAVVGRRGFRVAIWAIRHHPDCASNANELDCWDCPTLCARLAAEWLRAVRLHPRSAVFENAYHFLRRYNPALCVRMLLAAERRDASEPWRWAFRVALVIRGSAGPSAERDADRRALPFLRRAVASASGNRRLAMTPPLARTARRVGEVDLARRVLEETLQSFPIPDMSLHTGTVVRFQLHTEFALLELTHGDPGAAARHVREAVALSPPRRRGELDELARVAAEKLGFEAALQLGLNPGRSEASAGQAQGPTTEES